MILIVSAFVIVALIAYNTGRADERLKQEEAAIHRTIIRAINELEAK